MASHEAQKCSESPIQIMGNTWGSTASLGSTDLYFVLATSERWNYSLQSAFTQGYYNNLTNNYPNRQKSYSTNIFR